jgi:hypothetical protein
LAKFRRLPFWNIGINHHAERDMDVREDDSKRDAEKFRDYAAECRRLAQRASAKDRQVLMEIAQAWIACAEEAERKESSLPRKDE